MIYFLKGDEPYGWLGALSEHPINIDGEIWKTAEHYYQAQKFIHHPDLFNKIKDASSSNEARFLAKDSESFEDPTYDDRKLETMKRIMILKFEQHLDLKEKLIQTGNQPLIKNAPDCSFWGIGPDGKGLNMSGQIVMDIRKEYLC
jgi:ribA/ribD-fused uncharacterized protein